MNKHQFIEELRLKLKRLPMHEQENAVSYYIEYFEDAGYDDSFDVLSVVQSPSIVASQILSEYATKDFNKEDGPKKSKALAIWFIILAIFASPIALPLGFAMILLMVALTIAFGAVVLSLGIGSFSIVVSGVAIFISSIFNIFNHFSSSVLLVGVGLMLIGGGTLLLIATLFICNILLKLMIKVGSIIVNKINRKEMK